MGWIFGAFLLGFITAILSTVVGAAIQESKEKK
jgi:hypothetical protein